MPGNATGQSIDGDGDACSPVPFSLKWDNMRKELESFAAMASSCKGGRITIEEFARFLKLPVSSALEELFSLFDRVSVCVCV